MDAGVLQGLEGQPGWRSEDISHDHTLIHPLTPDDVRLLKTPAPATAKYGDTLLLRKLVLKVPGLNEPFYLGGSSRKALQGAEDELGTVLSSPVGAEVHLWVAREQLYAVIQRADATGRYLFLTVDREDPRPAL